MRQESTRICLSWALVHPGHAQKSGATVLQLSRLEQQWQLDSKSLGMHFPGLPKSGCPHAEREVKCQYVNGHAALCNRQCSIPHMCERRNDIDTRFLGNPASQFLYECLLSRFTLNQRL